MDDLEIRKFALDMATSSLRGAPFTEIVQAAEAYHAFLAGKTMPVSDALDYAKEMVQPPPIPVSNHDLGQAEQGPSSGLGLTAVGPIDPSVLDLIERDQDNIPTRLVRVPVASPE